VTFSGQRKRRGSYIKRAALPTKSQHSQPQHDAKGTDFVLVLPVTFEGFKKWERLLSYFINAILFANR